MSTASAASACPLCAGPLPDAGRPCSKCHASSDWIELGQGLDFALRRFEDWHERGQIGDARFRGLSEYYARQRETFARMVAEGQPVPEDAGLPARGRCWSCDASADAPQEFCAECGAPWDSPTVRSLRFWTFLASEIDRHGDEGRLSLNQAHDLKADVRERRSGLRRKLEKQRLPAVVSPTDEVPRRRSGERIAQPESPQRNVWELVLDPRTIQWLLGFGGALLVLGLVIWLAAAGFLNRWTVAGALGLANAAVLFGGWAVILRTRYQTAGRALTLLACLVMPLNLWYYHYQGILTFGDHLWLPALVCCVLYAASALVLRDQLFVHVLLGGVALTGLLILADMHKFHEIAAPSALLVVLGLVGIHTERAFAEGEGPFTRRRFGLAFFQSGQVLLAGGLLLLLGGQLAGWLYDPFFRHLGVAEKPVILTDPWLQVLAIGLVLAGTYAYVYSDIAVRRVGVYMYFAVFTLLWAEVLIVLRLGIEVKSEAVIALLAATALALNLLQATAGRNSSTLARATPPLGVFLATVPVALGVLLHYRATSAALHELWPYTIRWEYVGALLLTAVACRVGAHLCRHTLPWVSMVYFFGTAAATLAGAAALLTLLGVRSWDQQAAIVMLIPILYLLSSRLYRGHTAERPLTWAAHVATAFMIAGVITTALDITAQVEPAVGTNTNLLLALFCAEASVFYALASGLRKESWTLYASTVMACGAVWQLFSYWSVAPDYYTLAFAVLGFALLVAYRLALLERYEQGGLATAAFGSANALMSLAFVAAALLALSRLVNEQPRWSLVWLLLPLTVLSLAAAWLVRHPVWRPWYVVMAIAEALLMFVALELRLDLSAWQKVEIFSIVVGVLLLAMGHWGWYREQATDAERQSDAVSLALFFGSVLTGLPLAIAVLLYRATYHGKPGDYSWPNEVGMLVAGLLMLGTGFIFRLRMTTLSGGFLVALYVLTLPMLMHDLNDIQAAALGIAIGGGVVFGLGLVLSVYRDRLLMLPDRIKRREGIFRVLSWR
jgi:hypothetical protein